MTSPVFEMRGCALQWAQRVSYLCGFTSVSLAQHGQVPREAPEGWTRNLHVVAARDDEGTGDSLALATRVHEPDKMAAAVLALEKQRQVRIFMPREAERALTIL